MAIAVLISVSRQEALALETAGAPSYSASNRPLNRYAKPVAEDPKSLFRANVEGGATSLYDTLRANGVPADALTRAFRYFDAYKNSIANTRYLTVVDFSRGLGEKRLYLCDLRTGKVTRHFVSHGIGSDPYLNGHAARFSNRDGSNASSLGPFLTGQAYEGEFGHSLKVQGLSDKANSNASSRNIVVHPYEIGPGYNRQRCIDASERQERGLGRYCLEDGALTRGCFGLSQSESAAIVERIKGGSLIYAFSRQ